MEDRIRKAFQAWDESFEEMKSIFLPLYEEVKQDTNNFTKGHPVPWYHQYFRKDEINSELVVQFWTMSAACFE